MSIRLRLFTIFAVLLGALVAQVAAVLYYADANNRLTAELAKGVRNTAEIGGMATELQKLRRFEKEFIIYVANEPKRRGYADEVKGAVNAITEKLTRATLNRERRYTEEEVTRFKAWEQDLGFYYSEFEKLAAQAQAGTLVDSLAANAAIGPGKDRLRNFLDGASKDGSARQAAAIEASQSLYRNRTIVTWITAGIAGACGLLAILGYLILTASVVNPLAHIAETATRMSQGEVGATFPEHSAVEFRHLRSALEAMRTSLRSRQPARG